ncbi:MAG: P1 family peptidase [Planctomycetaceae bacterium]
MMTDNSTPDSCGMSRRDVLRIAGTGGAAAVMAVGPADVSGAPSRRPIDTSAGDHVLEFELPGVRIGSAVYPDGPTGSTVFHFPDRARGVVDIRGGAPATFWTDAMSRGAAGVDAICLTGGSIYGLEAVSGVASGLLSRREYSTHWDRIALVSGAVIYDFGARTTSVYPDRELGRAALAAARPGRFSQGAHGAGASASCGKWLEPAVKRELAGQGAAFAQQGPIRVGVFTVVNPVGAIVDRTGKVVRGHLDPKTGRRLMYNEPVLGAGEATPEGNTTLTVVVTNQKLGDWELSQISRQVHTSMARAIQPFHALIDGDVLYAVTTGEVGKASDRKATRTVVDLATRLAWDAVLSSFSGRGV